MDLRSINTDLIDLRATAGEALVLSRILDRDHIVADAAVLAGQGAVFAGAHAAARELLQEALSRAQAGGDHWVAAHAVIAQALLALSTGAYEAAENLLRDAERRARELGNAFTLATTLNVRATFSQLQADHNAAAVVLAEAIAISVDARIGWTLGYAIPAVAGVAVQLGELEAAARLFGASASLSAAHAVDARYPASRALSDRDLGAVRDQLGEATFRIAWDEGRTATVEHVAELARRLTQRARG